MSSGFDGVSEIIFGYHFRAVPKPLDVPNVLQNCLREAVERTGNASRVSRVVGAKSPGQLADWIAGRYNPELARLGEIAHGLRELGVTLPNLFGSDLSRHASTEASGHAPALEARVVELQAQNAELAQKVATYESGYRDVLAAFEALLRRYREAGGEDRAAETPQAGRRRRG